MIALIVFPVLLGFSGAAVWAIRSGGRRRLWYVGTAGLLGIGLVGLLLSAIYNVPSAARLVTYLLVAMGPAILFTTLSLYMTNEVASTPSTQVATGIAATLLGLVVGFGLAIYVLGVW